LEVVLASVAVVVVPIVCCTKWLGISNLMEKPVKLPSALDTGQWMAICELEEGCPGRTGSGGIPPVS